MSKIHPWAYVNGRIVKSDEQAISLYDRGFLYGEGLFETIRVKRGKCLRLPLHLNRLNQGSTVLNITIPSLDKLETAIQSVIDANNLCEARLRVTITPGEHSTAGINTSSSGSPTLVVTAYQLPDLEPSPLRVITSSLFRRDEQSPLSSVKSLNYLPSILALREARSAGADDAIMLNTKGNIAEGTTGNLFLRFGRILVTPSRDQGLVPGTVRATLIEIAPQMGMDLEERQVTKDDILRAEELFFTNAIQLMRPIKEVDGINVPIVKSPLFDHIRQVLEELE
jgi:branched-chain amino acid aminotransferase